jgi:hypothetical protein
VIRVSFLVPALLRFPGASARQDGWGRLLNITAGGAELSTGARLGKGESVLVRFELGGARLVIRAVVGHVVCDDDGQCLAELRWTDFVERRRLARALLDVLSKC